ncbi:MAG: dynamin family protein [Gammaproteobacteria bacterium]
MADPAKSSLNLRLQRLEAHLEQENPVLLQAVKSFRTLDSVGYRLGLLRTDESYATKVPWWPLISVLGTFSSGKSTFINHYLSTKLQLTGNQAVDDKFTVICYSSDGAARVLPGLALDADPRFPFYQISEDIDRVVSGEGRRVDAYLQLKTCPSERLRGKIIIDSPGFDADAQRTSTLRITDHIIDLSDLVLVFFDARHPEPGAMQDTLQHLVADTIKRPDSNKFLYILNQIDATAREDNPEEVVAAWQRALAQKGLTAGRFYRIYNPDAAIPIENEKLRLRYETKRDTDLADIHTRLQQVGEERAYRIVGVLEKIAKTIEHQIVPSLRQARLLWKRRTLWADGIVFTLLVLGFLAWSISAGYWDGLLFSPPWLASLSSNVWLLGFTLAALAGAGLYLHMAVRKLAARTVISKLRRDSTLRDYREPLIAAFIKNTHFTHSIFGSNPVGWGTRARKRIAQVLKDADLYVQTLNDQFTNPSGSLQSEPGLPPTRTEATDRAAEASAQPETFEAKIESVEEQQRS